MRVEEGNNPLQRRIHVLLAIDVLFLFHVARTQPDAHIGQLELPKPPHTVRGKDLAVDPAVDRIARDAYMLGNLVDRRPQAQQSWLRPGSIGLNRSGCNLSCCLGFGCLMNLASNWFGLLIDQRIHGVVVSHITEPTRNTKQTALGAYLASATAIHAKLSRLQHLVDDHFGRDT